METAYGDPTTYITGIVEEEKQTSEYKSGISEYKAGIGQKTGGQKWPK